MTAKDNWDDLRFVLAVAETGSVSGAARQMGVNHVTVLRRIAAFEDRYGGPVFEKSLKGYSIPPDRLRVIEAAREVEAAVAGVERLMHGVRAPLRGAVRVTSTDTFCLTILPQLIARLREDAPELRIDLHCSNAHLDMARLQADITVRPAIKLSEELFGKAVAMLNFAVYAAKGVQPRAWLGLSDPLSRSVPGRWLEANIGSDQLVGASDSFPILREMVAHGTAMTFLPCILGDNDPRLARQTIEVPEIAVPIWVASHSDLADAPRIRAVREAIGEAIAEELGQSDQA